MTPNAITQPISSNTLILDIVEGYPQTIAVFNQLNMACPGCPIAPFHTVSDSAREYGLRPEELLRALNNAVHRL
jgi:hybrid cluster-associated redox disulfide protein